jgi:hypothetical protein
MVLPDSGIFPDKNRVGEIPITPKLPKEQVIFALAPRVVDPLEGKMEATPVEVPDENVSDDGCSDLLGVVEGTKTLELGC